MDTTATHASYGKRFVDTIKEVMEIEAHKDAFVDRNGDVEINRQYVEEAVYESEQTYQAFKEVFDMLYETVADEVTHEQRVAWAEERDLERTLAAEDSHIKQSTITQLRRVGS